MGFRSGLVFALALLIAIAGPGCRGEEGGEGDSVTSGSGRRVDFYACRKSLDCVIEKQKDCCPCNAGGKQVALHKARLGDYRAALEVRCAGDLLCPQSYLCDDRATAVCRAGRCEIVPGSREMRKGPAIP